MYENLGKIQTKYERIPGFFQKRIVNTVLICMVLLYCGCTFGMAEESTGFVLWDRTRNGNKDAKGAANRPFKSRTGAG